MTPREAVLSAINHREVFPVPYVLGFDGDVGDRLDAHYGGPQWRNRLQTYIDGTYVVDYMAKKPIDGRDGYYTDGFGSVWRMDPQRPPMHLETPAMPEPSFRDFAWPSAEHFYRDAAGIAEAQEHCRRHKDRYLYGAVYWGLMESSWGLRGFQEILMDAAAEPAFYEEMLDRITALFLDFVEFTCRHLPDVDAIMFGDDWGDQRGVIIGTERWQRLFKPRWAKIYARVHDHGKHVITHCCGSIIDILDDLVEIGLDVLESCQPEARGMNPYALKQRFGDKLTFWGALGSQSTVPFGTPEQIGAEVRRLCREMGKGGGYILAPAKSLQPETPTANAAAVVEAFTRQDGGR